MVVGLFARIQQLGDGASREYRYPAQTPNEDEARFALSPSLLDVALGDQHDAHSHRCF